MTTQATAVTSDLGRRWLDATTWHTVRGEALRELVGIAGLGRLAFFDGSLGFLALTTREATTGVGEAERVADLLTPTFAQSCHGTYQVDEHDTYRWTTYLAPLGEARFVAAYTTRVDDRWELRVAEVDRSTVGGLLVDLATVVPRLPVTGRLDTRPGGSGDHATLTAAELDELTAMRGRSAEALALLSGAGWPTGLARALSSAVDEPIVGVEAQTGARRGDGSVSLGHHQLWLTGCGWSWRVDPDPERPLLTRLGPVDALHTLTRPLSWLDDASTSEP